MTDATLYHNPRCSKSRAALELLQARGVEPSIVRYLETPPTDADLRALLRKLDIPTVPVIMGILLGNAMEKSLRDAMVLSDGNWTYLFSSGISTGLIVAAVLGFVAPIFLRRFIRRPQAVAD